MFNIDSCHRHDLIAQLPTPTVSYSSPFIQQKKDDHSLLPTQQTHSLFSVVSNGGVNDGSLLSSLLPPVSLSLVNHRSFSIIAFGPILIVECYHAFLPLTIHRATNKQAHLPKFAVLLLSVGTPYSTVSQTPPALQQTPRAFSTPTLACVIAVSTRNTSLLCCLRSRPSAPPSVSARCG